MTLSPDEIRALVGPCDDEQMAKYREVAREAIAAFNSTIDNPFCPPSETLRKANGRLHCRHCWREYLEWEDE